MAEASKKGISSIDLKQSKEVDSTKLKQRTKAAAKSTAKTKVSKNRDSGSSNSNLLRRMQDLLPLNSSNSEESSNPLLAVQKIAGSVLKLNADEKVKEEWVPVFPKTRIMPGEMVPVTVAGIDLLVIASNDGQSLYCIANSCPHLGTPLETGQLTRLPIEESSVSSITTTRTAFGPPQDKVGLILSETDVAKILSQDGCEDCIVCPLHRTAFALQSGEVRGEWCPYPPVLGKVMGTVKQPTAAAVFDIRTKGKNIEVRLNSVVSPREDPKKDAKR
jgi:nitrite reductase/ring-hydroxylating ferredoxin subunit